MSKRFIVIAVVAIAVITVVLSYSFYPSPISVDNIGGKYNASITYWNDHLQLTYTDEMGLHVSSYFDNSMKLGLNWINYSTPENAVFLCWWDYGHMIKAVGERESLLRNPSQEILTSIADPSGIKEFDPDETIRDVAQAFATANQFKLLEIMGKYNATYVMVNEKDDTTKAAWIFELAGLNSTDYLYSDGQMAVFTDLGNNTMLARLIDNRDTNLTLVYQDQQVKIYQLSGV